ncbi:MAG TPA: GGDEF domain-containing protein, partial [Marinagarivorans sp.]
MAARLDSMGLANTRLAVFKVIYVSISLAVLSCILVAAIDPEKSFQLYPYPGSVAHLYADSIEAKGTSVASWIDRENGFFECKVSYGVQYPFCGVIIKYKHPDSKNFGLMDYFEFSDAMTLDLSDYDRIYISMEYSGENKSLYFFMRNTQILPNKVIDYDNIPYAHVSFFPAETGTSIELSRVQIARWWIDRFDPPSDQRQPKFESIYELGVELPALPTEGAHQFKLNHISARKSYIPQKPLLFTSAALVGIGLLVLIIQGALKYFSNRRENETLRTKMGIDPLTKCLNRLGLETAVRRLFPLVSQSSVYVIVLDLDHFKRINDTFGHVAGDGVLRNVAMALSKELRSDDVFGRWGGEEFVLISKINRRDLENMIGRMMRSLESIFVEGAPDDYRVSMSIGVTEAQVGEAFDDVFKRADEAMYQVKQAGRRN